MSDLKKSVFLTSKATISDHSQPNDTDNQSVKDFTPTILVKTPDGIRIRRLPVSTDKTPRTCQKHDLEVQSEISDIGFLGQFCNDRKPTILLKLPNVWQKRQTFSSAVKLKTFKHSIYLIRQLTKRQLKKH